MCCCRPQGRTYEPGGIEDESADAIREFNQFVRQDARVDVVMLPFRDGVSIITRRCDPIVWISLGVTPTGSAL